MIKLTRPEIVAIYLYHNDYAASGKSARAFYKQLNTYTKRHIAHLLRELDSANANRTSRRKIDR
jgi:hypothetical protein